MVTRTAAHYPNSNHTTETLSVVAEDWYHSFKNRLTERAFVEAITAARRHGGHYFPTENDIFNAAGLGDLHNCKTCGYYKGGSCPNLQKEGFNPVNCSGYMSAEKHKG